MKRVVIVGGGMTGLAAAHALSHAEHAPRVTLIEAEGRLGGAVSTLAHNAFVMDIGPDGWPRHSPDIDRLARDLALGDEIIGTRPDARKVYIARQRRLFALSDHALTRLPLDPAALVRSELLGWDATLRVHLDRLTPRRSFGDDNDETVSAFVSRRLGEEYADRVASPLVAGTVYADPEALSVRACAPELVEDERLHGSLLLAARERARARSDDAGRGSGWVSLKRGVGDLVVNLAHKLKDVRVLTSCAAERVERGPPEGPPWLVHTTAGVFKADEVVLAVPAYRAATLVEAVDPGLAAGCDEIAFASSARVFLAYRKYDVRHPLDAFGIVIPRSERRPVLECTFASSKWDHRAPAGQILLSVHIGGPWGEALVPEPDEALVQVARGQLADLLHVERQPIFAKVFRFERAHPLPTVGHLSRVRTVLGRAALHAGLHLGGPGFGGRASLPDAVRRGYEVADAIGAGAG